MSNTEKEIITEDEGGEKTDWRLFCLLNMTKIKVGIGIFSVIVLTLVGFGIYSLTFTQDEASLVKFKISQFEKSSNVLRSKRETSKNSIKRIGDIGKFLDEKYSELEKSVEPPQKVLKRESGIGNTIDKFFTSDLSSDELNQLIDDDLEDINQNFKFLENDVGEYLRAKRLKFRGKREIESKSLKINKETVEHFLSRIEEKKREKRVAQQNFADIRDQYIRCKKSTENSKNCENIYESLMQSFNEMNEKFHEIDKIIRELETFEKAAQTREEDGGDDDDDIERKKFKDDKKKKKKKDKKVSSEEESAESEEKKSTTEIHKLVTSSISTTTTTSTTTEEIDTTITDFTTETPTTPLIADDELTTTTVLLSQSESDSQSCNAVLNDAIQRHPMIDSEIEDFNVKMGHENRHHSLHDFVSRKLHKNIGDDFSSVGRIIDIYGSSASKRRNEFKIDTQVTGPFMALCDQMSKQQHKQSQTLNNLPFSNFPTTAESSKGTSKVVMNPGFHNGYPLCFVNYLQPQMMYPVMPYVVQPQFIYPTAFSGNMRPVTGMPFQPSTYRADDAATFCTFDAGNNGNLPVHFQPSTEATPPAIDERRDNVPTPFDVIFATFPNQMINSFNHSTQNHCDNGKIPCFTTSQCISTSSWCDSNVDCLDASDETACTCKSRLHESRICDGYIDCPMGSDELGCFECDKFQFSCYNSVDDFQMNSNGGGMTCYSATEKCDGFINCRNGRDEMDCTMLVKNFGAIVNPFLVGQSEGVLYRNYKGRWYLVCDGPEKWISEACEAEIGQESQPTVEIRNLNLDGPFLSEENLAISIVDNCRADGDKNSVIVVKCTRPKCGSSKLQEIEQKTPERRAEPGENEVGAERIVGGSDALPMEFPFIVAIFKDGNFHCGGSIFDEQWIITAAHCLKNSNSHYYEVRAGVLRRSSFSPQSQVSAVTHAIAHSEYSHLTMANDIGLLKVKIPFSFNRWVRPICLPKVPKSSKKVPAPKTICTTLGWGALKERGPDPDGLKVVDVPIHAKCKYENDIMSDSICAGETFGTRDACQGDSGGPLVCRSTSDAWILAGIVSHGQGCARADEPGVYTRVSLYIDWIKNQIENPDLDGFTTNKLCPGFVCVWGVQKCLPKRKVCNGHVDCLGGEDEISCDNNWLNLFNLDGLLGRSGKIEDMQQSIDPSESETKPDKKKIVKKDVPRAKFECKKISQIINANQRCDQVFDCEDGTDELNCTCVDHLKAHFPQLICDGNVDCSDSTDEKGCLNCTETQFACRHSRMCIERELRCDGQNDCRLHEDELYCMTLSDGKSVSLDINEKPILRHKGIVTKNMRSSWEVLCDSKFIENQKETADSICQLIGFHSSKSSRPVDMKFFHKISEFSLKIKSHEKESANIIREEIEHHKDECVALEIECLPAQSNFSVHHLINQEKMRQNRTKTTSKSGVTWPWTAIIFIDGKPEVVGVLMNENWILVNKNAMRESENLLQGHQMAAILGNPHANLKIQSSHEQVRKIDCIKSLNNSNALLLHMETQVEFNRYVLASFIHNSTKKESHCIALTLDDDDHVRKILLEEKKCGNGNCYQLHPALKGKFDCDTDHKISPAVIMCKNNHTSWYPKSVTHKSICEYRNNQIESQKFDWNEIQSVFDSSCVSCIKQTSIIECKTHLCPLGNCLQSHEICDGKRDCHDGSDEKTCETKPCTVDKFTCKNGKCIEKSKFCDHVNDCGDRTDEPSECTCFSFLKATAPEKICDGIRHCWDRSDEETHFCGKLMPEQRSFKCGKSEFLVSLEMVCDGRFDCPNKADEENCLKLWRTQDGFGEVIQRSFGIWSTKCYPKSSQLDIEEIGKEICGSSKVSIKITNHNVNDTEIPFENLGIAAVPMELQKLSATKVVSESKFSPVKINDGFTVHLRSDKPLAKISEWDDDDHANCHRLEVKCGE